jgi:Bifunctional DNA primase/polymerase, N-terminal
MTVAMIAARTERRLQLRARGYLPIPLHGKVPPMKAWQSYTVISHDMLVLWSKVFPLAENTGVLTRYTPTLDIDIRNEEAARAIEDLARERFEERGWFLVRIGKPPKRAILFRTNTPFRKITAPLIAPNGGSDEKIELLCDGQQLVVDGIHPETKQPYRWFGGEPWRIRRDELPYISEAEAQKLINDAATLLSNAFGYTRTAATPKSNGVRPGGEERWHALIDNILHSRDLHASFRDLAAMLFASGMQSGPAKHLLQALGEFIEPYDARVEARLRDIERAVDTAFVKYSKR